jgi:hypothetical protein
MYSDSAQMTLPVNVLIAQFNVGLPNRVMGMQLFHLVPKNCITTRPVLRLKGSTPPPPRDLFPPGQQQVGRTNFMLPSLI